MLHNVCIQICLNKCHFVEIFRRERYSMFTKRVIKVFLFGLFIIMASLSILRMTSQNIQAGTVTDKEVLAVSPPGITLDGYFTPGTFTGNSATVINPNGADIVRLTDNSNQTGAIWSNNDKNYLDITKKQTISMWMYFGTILYPSGVPDGMAFVLQNDGRGASAISMNGTKVNHGQSLGVWGLDTDNSVTNGNKSNAIQKQAIQNSFALEFDTSLNRNGAYAWQPNDPDNKLNGQGKSFDTMPYSGTNNYLSGPHIAWNYPADANTYKQLSTNFNNLFINNSIMGMYHHLGSDLATNGNNVDFSYGKGNSNTYQDGWQHTTIEYIPNPDGKTAQLNYQYKDKNYNGTPRAPVVKGTANIDLSVFQLNGSNKLRYGFTASTGDTADITDAVIFESMPSLVNAETNAYTVDKTNSTRISNSQSNTDVNQNNELIDDEANNLTTAKTVHPKDNLTLNYMLHYLSGEDPTNGVNATVNIPDNVTITPDSDGNIGEIYYQKTDSTGNKTVESDAISSNNLTGNKFTYNDIKNLGDTAADNLTTVRIELNATANTLPTGTTSLNVPTGLATFEGTNFKGDFQSDSFDIVKPTNTLHITTDMADPTEVKLGDKFNLTGDISFGTPETVDKNDMYINYTIDNNPTVRSQDTSAGSGFTIYDLETGKDAGQLDAGDHTIKVQVIDNNYPMANNTVDTLVSNTLEYHIKVTDQSVVVTPDKNEITVNDNEPLKLTGTYEHSDNTSTVSEGGTSVIAYTITTADGKKQNEVSESQTNNGKYDFTVKPYAYDKDPAVSLDDYTGQTGLKVGQNIVSISVVDQDGHKSEAKEVIVNVPDIKPTLTTDQNEFNIIQGDAIDMTGNVGYSDGYQVTPSKLTWYINANGNKMINSYSGDEPVSTPMTQNFTIDSTANGITDDVNNPYPVSIYFTDPYGRTSETLDYNVNVMEKTATIESTDYKFKNINASGSPRVVGRDGTWNLQVKSVMSKWTLTAKAGRMVTGAGTSDPVTLDGNLIYVSPDNEVSDMSTQTFIQNNSDDSKVKTTDIGGSWAPDEGILLDVNSSTLAGTYSGKVEWDLTNSI